MQMFSKQNVVQTRQFWRGITTDKGKKAYKPPATKATGTIFHLPRFTTKRPVNEASLLINLTM